MNFRRSRDEADPSVHSRWFHLHRHGICNSRTSVRHEILAIGARGNWATPRCVHDGAYSTVRVKLRALHDACNLPVNIARV